MTATGINIRYMHLNNNKVTGLPYISPLFRICAILEGGAVWEINHCAYNVKKGDIVLLNITDSRFFRHVVPGQDLKILVIEFGPKLLHSNGFFPLFKNNIKSFSPVITYVPQQISDIVEHIQKEHAAKHEEYKIIISADVVQMLAYIMRYYKKTGFNFDDYQCNKTVLKALDYINANFCKDIDLQTAADLIPMSRSAFSKCFLKYNGIGFNRYVRIMRIERAVHLLESTDETVLSIAAQCGFKNGASFYKAFNQIVGVPPTLYKNKEVHKNEKK